MVRLQTGTRPERKTPACHAPEGRDAAIFFLSAVACGVVSMLAFRSNQIYTYPLTNTIGAGKLRAISLRRRFIGYAAMIKLIIIIMMAMQKQY